MRTIPLCVMLTTVLLLPCLAGDKVVAVINAAGLQASLVETIRAHAERELYVPVVARTVAPFKDDDLKAMGKKAIVYKMVDDVCLLVLASPGVGVDQHVLIMTNEMVAVINITALASPDENIFTRRLQRWTLRGTAFLMGIEPDPDPFCVMHDYETIADFDKIGRNFSPPWGEKFRKAAKAQGLTVRSLSKLRQRPVMPAAVPAVPSPALGKTE